MSDYRLTPDKPIDVAEILKDLKDYRPRRRGWVWRKPVENLHMGPFEYHDCTEPLERSVPLPPAHRQSHLLQPLLQILSQVL